MSQARTSKKKAEEATFRASEEVEEVTEEDKEFEANAVDKAKEVGDKTSEEVEEVTEEDKEFEANAVDKAKEVGDKASEEVKEVAGASTYFCSNCGKELDTESNFCPKCGVRTENGVKAGVAIPWTSDPHLRQELDVALQKASKAIDDGVKVVRETFREVAGEVERGMKQARTSVPVTCQNCGQENTRFAKFCRRCGKEL
jgi:membrane protease subunit (stomatin/prohibitin family)